jgi:hypothetical protein
MLFLETWQGQGETGMWVVSKCVLIRICPVLILFYLFLATLGVERRPLFLLGRCSTTWPALPALLCLFSRSDAHHAPHESQGSSAAWCGGSSLYDTWLFCSMAVHFLAVCSLLPSATLSLFVKSSSCLIWPSVPGNHCGCLLPQESHPLVYVWVPWRVVSVLTPVHVLCTVQEC